MISCSPTEGLSHFRFFVSRLVVFVTNSEHPNWLWQVVVPISLLHGARLGKQIRRSAAGRGEREIGQTSPADEPRRSGALAGKGVSPSLASNRATATGSGHKSSTSQAAARLPG